MAATIEPPTDETAHPARPGGAATPFLGAVAPPRPGGARPGAASSSGSASAPVFRTPTRTGTRWLAGLAADRTWPLKSLLVAADVFAEQFRGLGLPVDWTAEVGARHQLSPRLTLDAGAGHRFAGATRAWFVTAGLTREFGI